MGGWVRWVGGSGGWVMSSGSVKVSRVDINHQPRHYHTLPNLNQHAPAEDGVGGREDGGAGVERGVDAGLGDGDGLLLHRLVDRHLLVCWEGCWALRLVDGVRVVW